MTKLFSSIEVDELSSCKLSLKNHVYYKILLKLVLAIQL